MKFSEFGPAGRKANMDNKRSVALEIDLKTHPLAYLEKFAKDRSDVTGFKLYSYNRDDGLYDQSAADVAVYPVLAADVVSRGLEVIADSFKKGLDVVLGSEVFTNNGIRHLQLIDFSIKEFAPLFKGDFPTNFARIMGLYPELMTLYASGRSFHGYGPKLMSLEQWQHFNHSLLLLPPAFGEPVVPDFRWVGHCLVRGFSAIRLSATDNNYLQMPKLVYQLDHT